jgi:hypothetical protein
MGKPQGKVITGNPPAMASPQPITSQPMKITVKPPVAAKPGDAGTDETVPPMPKRRPWRPTGDGPPSGTIGHLGGN